MKLTLLAFAVVTLLPLSYAAQSPAQNVVTVTAVNRMKIARQGETLEFTASFTFLRLCRFASVG